jgi:hypothetical protein
MPTQEGSPIYTGSQPGVDSAVVGICRAAGAIILGKTVCSLQDMADDRQRQHMHSVNMGLLPVIPLMGDILQEDHLPGLELLLRIFNVILHWGLRLYVSSDKDGS